jgi:hypothetical protein
VGSSTRRGVLLRLAVVLAPGGCAADAPEPFVAQADEAMLDAVREEIRFTWSSYVEHAWGRDELRPVSRAGADWGPSPIGLTILDGVDTLLVAGPAVLGRRHPAPRRLGARHRGAPAPEVAMRPGRRLRVPFGLLLAGCVPDGDAPCTACDDGTSDSDAPRTLPLPAAATCAPAGDACATTPVDGLFATYRKDAYFPDEVYDEYTDAPLDGGRVQVVGRAAVSGHVTGVLVDGVDVATILTPPDAPGLPPFDWAHVWPEDVVAGEPVWVAFHTRDPAWDHRTSAPLVVRTDAGDAVAGTFPVGVGPVRLTYVTTSDDLATTVIHVENRDEVAHRVTRVVVDGEDVTDAACLAEPVLAPHASALVTVPRCAPTVPGAAWTVVLELDDAPAAVGAGRVLRPSFPIEAWNNTSECPWPGGDDDNARAYAAAGIDTHYLHGGVCGACGCDTRTLLEQTYPAAGLRTLVTDDLARALLPLATTTAVAAISTGDESDGELLDDDGVPAAARKARTSQELWRLAPEVPTFNGGMTSGHVGAFAGMADLQGMDVYIGGCAPHVTRWGTHPPVRMPYDYLRNARENQLPLPTWLYTQGLSPAGWKAQPAPQEIRVQGIEAIAAGAKGLMWFQANQDAAREDPARWQAIVDVNRVVGALRGRLRTSDPIPGASASLDTVLVDALRGEDAIVVPVVQLRTTQAPTDLTCLASAVPHVFADDLVDVSVEVPPDLAVVDAFEVTPTGVDDVAARVEGRRVTLPAVPLSNDVPARVLVLAASAAVREVIDGALRAGR